jgi:hypothetical protein
MSQTLSIYENYLVVFVSLRICFEIFPGIYLEIFHVGKNIEKFMVSRNFRLTHLLEVGLTQIPVDHAPLSIFLHLELHVDFSSTNFFFGHVGLHLLV